MNKTTRQIKPVYAIVSADRFLRGEVLAELLAGVGEDSNPSTRYDGSSADLAEVLDEARTYSLLAGRSIVVVDDADKFVTNHRPSLERYCAEPAESGTLILLCKSMPRNTRLYKIIAACGEVIVREPPKPQALIGWAMDRARRSYGKQLGREAAHRLCQHIGNAPGAIDAELAKLASYVGDRAEITGGDIAALTGQLREEKAFAVIDAIAIGDAAAALGLWEQVLATNRAAPALAVGGLSFSLRRLLEARIDFDNGVSPTALARKLFTHPDRVEARLRRSSPDRLRQMQRDLLAVDLAVKTGGTTVERGIEKFIVKHAVRGTTPRVKAG